MRFSIFMTFAAMLLFLAPSDGAAAATPNVVIFLSDDMGWGQPGFQGGNAIPTPNLDRLAAEGASLTQFYVHSVCSPTRAALMTGRYPFRNGMEERSHANDTAGMLTDEQTLADALRQAGYFTAVFGKWHLGEWHKRHLPMQRGFDHQYGHYSALVDSFTHQRGPVFDWHRNEQPIHEEGYTTFLIADEFHRVLERHDASQPFFFYVPFNAVHGPHDAPAEYIQKHNGNKQHAMLECMDVAIGRMLGALERKGALDNTLVIFLNDNGGPRRLGNAPYRGTKGTTYEGGVRVACLVRWPKRIRAGQQIDEMVHVVDLYPTLIKLAGGSLDQPLPLDGLDVWETIAQGKPSPRTEVVHSVGGFAQSETGPPAIRVGDFKLVSGELYDLRKDPYETNNLADALPDKVRDLKERLAQLESERRTPETHNRIPNGPPAVYGEQENLEPLPDWLRQLAEANKGRAPRRAQKKKKETDDK